MSVNGREIDPMGMEHLASKKSPGRRSVDKRTRRQGDPAKMSSDTQWSCRPKPSVPMGNSIDFHGNNI